VVEAEDADEEWDKRGDGGRGACVRSSSNASNALLMHKQRKGRSELRQQRGRKAAQAAEQGAGGRLENR
jgi:hypothetical protein